MTPVPARRPSLDRTGWSLEILGDGGRHHDPELRAEPEHEDQAPVTSRLRPAVSKMLTHGSVDLCTNAGRTRDEALLRDRYFVAHANVKNTTKLAPIAIQTHADTNDPPDPRFPCRPILPGLRFRSLSHLAVVVRFP